MIIQTTKGPRDDSTLDVERIEIDDARMFGYELRYSERDGAAEVICVMREVKIWKFDPLTEITAMVDGIPGVMKLADLDVTSGCVDNENEYTRWIEYRLRGTDTLVSRGAHTNLKRHPAESKSEAGGL